MMKFLSKIIQNKISCQLKKKKKMVSEACSSEMYESRNWRLQN